MSEETQANGETMRVDPQRAQALAENVGSVLQKISGAAAGRQVQLARDRNLANAAADLQL